MENATIHSLKRHRVSCFRAYIPWKNYKITVRKGDLILWGLRSLTCFTVTILLTASTGMTQLITPDDERYTQVAACRMITASQELLSPVYGPLAEQIVARAEAEELKKLFKKLQIETFRVEIPEPPNAEDVNYGIWIELRAPYD